MNKKIKILVLDNTFTFGGAINSLSYLIQALDKERFEPILVTGQSEELLRDKFSGTIYHRHVPKLPWVNNRIYTKIASLPLFKIKLLRIMLNFCRYLYWVFVVDFMEALHYMRIGKRYGVRMVHLNNIMGSQLSGIIAAKLLGVPCVAHLRDFEVVHPITRLYAKLIDRHVAISEAIKDNLLRLGVAADRISIVHDAINLAEFDSEIDCRYLPDEFGLGPDQLKFGLFGRVIDWKGTREFLLAAQMVIDKIPTAHGFIVGGASDGDEDYYREMLSLAKELGLAGKVTFTGYRKDIPALMKFMDLIVHASIRAEPFGMVLIEGMAMGKPVVATRAGGPLDIVVDGETGYLVPVGDVAALGGAVTRLLQDNGLRNRMGIKGKQKVANEFSSQRYARQMEEVYQELAGLRHE